MRHVFIVELGLENTENNIRLLCAVLEKQDVINIKYRVVDGVIQAKLKPELTQLLASQPPVDLNLTTPEKEKPSLITSLTESERGFEQIRDETNLCNSRILSTDSEPERVFLDISQKGQVAINMNNSGIGTILSPETPQSKTKIESVSKAMVSSEVFPEPLKATLIATPIATNMATPIATNISSPIATNIATPIATPIATHMATPEATSKVTPLCTPIATPLATQIATSISTSTYTPMNEKNVNWKCGDRAVGFWSSECLWREAVVIQVFQVTLFIKI